MRLRRAKAYAIVLTAGSSVSNRQYSSTKHSEAYALQTHLVVCPHLSANAVLRRRTIARHSGVAWDRDHASSRPQDCQARTTAVSCLVPPPWSLWGRLVLWSSKQMRRRAAMM